MGLFSKSLTDEEWLNQAKPLYDAILPITTALSEAVENPPLPDNYHKDLQESFERLSTIAQSLKNLPNPTSSKARRAKKDLESAIKDYMKGTKYGLSFYAGAYGKFGDIVSTGVGLHKLAEATLAGILSNFIKSIKSGQNSMKKANDYFQTQ
jgi:hypothetical protein